MMADTAQGSLDEARRLRDAGLGQEAIEKYTKAVALIRSDRRQDLLAAAEFELGAQLMGADGREDEALEHLEEASRAGPGTWEEAWARLVAGGGYGYLGRGPDAYNAYDRAVDLFEKLGAPEEEAEARGRAVDAARRLGDQEGMCRHLPRLISLLDDAGQESRALPLRQMLMRLNLGLPG